MGKFGLLKPLLLIYECFRILLLAALVYYQPVDPAGFPRLIYTGSAALFTLMAVFIWLNIRRYRTYLPLFAAGKLLNICTLAVWLVFQRFKAAATGILSLDLLGIIFLTGDILSICIILALMKDIKKPKRINETGITEVN